MRAWTTKALACARAPRPAAWAAALKSLRRFNRSTWRHRLSVTDFGVTHLSKPLQSMCDWNDRTARAIPTLAGARRSVASARARVVRPKPCGRPWSPCVYGSRDAACAPVCSVDRSVSQNFSASRLPRRWAAIGAAYTGGLLARQRNLGAIRGPFGKTPQARPAGWRQDLTQTPVRRIIVALQRLAMQRT